MSDLMDSEHHESQTPSESRCRDGTPVLTPCAIFKNEHACSNKLRFEIDFEVDALRGLTSWFEIKVVDVHGVNFSSKSI